MHHPNDTSQTSANKGLKLLCNKDHFAYVTTIYIVRFDQILIKTIKNSAKRLKISTLQAKKQEVVIQCKDIDKVADHSVFKSTQSERLMEARKQQL